MVLSPVSLAVGKCEKKRIKALLYFEVCLILFIFVVAIVAFTASCLGGSAAMAGCVKVEATFPCRAVLAALRRRTG